MALKHKNIKWSNEVNPMEKYFDENGQRIGKFEIDIVVIHRENYEEIKNRIKELQDKGFVLDGEMESGYESRGFFQKWYYIQSMKRIRDGGTK